MFQRRGTPQILLLLSDGSSLRSSEIDAAIPTIKRQILGTRLNETKGTRDPRTRGRRRSPDDFQISRDREGDSFGRSR